MSLKYAVLFSILATVCCQIPIPISLQDISSRTPHWNLSLTNLSFPDVPGDGSEFPDVGDSKCIAKLKTLYSGLSSFNQESIACK